MFWAAGQRPWELIFELFSQLWARRAQMTPVAGLERGAMAHFSQLLASPKIAPSHDFGTLRFLAKAQSLPSNLGSCPGTTATLLATPVRALTLLLWRSQSLPDFFENDLVLFFTANHSSWSQSINSGRICSLPFLFLSFLMFLGCPSYG